MTPASDVELGKEILAERQGGAPGPAHAAGMARAAGLLAAMAAALEAGEAREALDLGIAAKSLHLPVRDLDLLRARTFQRLGRPLEAVQSFKEELRHFPDNAAARTELAALQRERPAPADEPGEFGELLALVREHTMLGVDRLRSLYTLGRDVCERDTPGCFVECGVAGGGSSALLGMVIARHSRRPRTLYALDSFAGMPQPGKEDVHQDIPAESTGWGTGTCAAPEEAVRELYRRLGVSNVIETRKGLFQDTLPQLRKTLAPVAFLHLDGDWYESTLTVLENLRGLYAPGGFIQIDDYGHWEGCRKAVHEFEQRHATTFNLHAIDYSGVWCEAV